MMRALWTAAAGMMTQQFNVDTIANNLANINTTGFKRTRAEFEDLIYETIRAAGTTTAAGTVVPVGVEVGHGAVVSATTRIFTEGSLQRTENPLDLAIEGEGFFQIILPDGTVAYTRDGSFRITADGRVTTSDGYLLEPELTIPPDAVEITVGEDGRVSVLLAGEREPTEIGAIEIVKFINPAGLHAMGKNLFLQTAASGDPISGTPGTEGLGTIAQGFLERSNVNIVEEMVNMIIAQRAYEANSRSVITSDFMLGVATALRR